MTKHIRGRELWGAAPARSFQIQHPDKVHTLVVHHTAGSAPVVPALIRRELRKIQSMHMNGNGWSDIGYNLIIDRLGNIWEGRGLRRVGAHTKNCNTNTIGVSFMGNYENLTLTKKQIAAFNDVKKRLRMHGIRVESIKGHRDMPRQKTACPGKNVMRQLGL